MTDNASRRSDRTTARVSTSARVRARLDHPVIDADGHIVECTPVLLEYMKDVGGPGLAQGGTSTSPSGVGVPPL